MNWIKIDIENYLPDEEVLALNDCNDVLVGHLSEGYRGSPVACESEETCLMNVTHYILISELLKTVPK